MTTPTPIRTPTRSLTARSAITLVLGVILFGIGFYLAIRRLWTNVPVVSGPPWLDMAFAAGFMLRGAVNFRAVLNRRRQHLSGQ
ncbi:MAG: hypothetical protein ABJF01_13715 [bacterium]